MSAPSTHMQTGAPDAPLTVEKVLGWLREHARHGENAAHGEAAAALARANLSADSRELSLGDVFLAYPVGNAHGNGSQRSDGRPYIAAAAEAGAAAILYEPDDMLEGAALAIAELLGTPRAQDLREGSRGEAPVAYGRRPAVLPVPGLAALAGEIADAWYGRPSAAMQVVGVTGTNGKTSCAMWTAHMLAARRCAVIGTLGAGFPGAMAATGFTTPDATRLQCRLAALRAAGAGALAMEVSSHALDQNRVGGVRFHTAVFTNLTQDHLDYHGDMAEYEAAKARLFRWPGLRAAVINLDDPAGLRLLGAVAPGVRVIGYSLRDPKSGPVQLPADCELLLARDVDYAATGLRFSVLADIAEPGEPAAARPLRQARVETGLLGEFNVRNALAVLGAALACGMPWREALAALSHLPSVPGRMEQVDSGAKAAKAAGKGRALAPAAVIDFAHTPDALEKALAALRPLAAARGGELWCVFGCGGDRDAGKRPKMGAAAERLADHVVLTSDNPRRENAESIIAMIQSGMREPAKAAVMTDRAAAILHALRRCADADVVLVAGKGHEAYQEIAGKKAPFSDNEHVSLALAARVTMADPGARP
ncbi:MAG: UDP-N-acetylmuramoyl-L-alanyl-D-glutamate--2,6-diaminopimelate ligase [Candidatus Protistobacter heckmanni]|nr:UDP-N-acetylmuramoyl-L-alanyl-D-glutamate--2,6-diaminopimelate ligase [Candidatus Protistobacter heckmanni]